MHKPLETKLQDLPTCPGVYFHKDAQGEIIYIGKAANLRNRVRHYFQKSRNRDPKTDALVAEIADLDWLELETELDALFVEAEMVRRYMPRYNILLRDDKSFTYVRIDIKSDYPSVTFTRRPLDDKAEYFGPYLSKSGISTALRHLRKIFPYSTHEPTNIPKRACLQAQIGFCPGLEAGLTSRADYCRNLRQLMLYLRGKRKKLIDEIEKEMNRAAKAQKYEEAAGWRNKLLALKNIERQIIFGDREILDIRKDNGLARLSELLKLKKVPKRIEGFDISHMSGTDNVASMVVFVSGVPDKSQYRKFKMRLRGNNDFAHMNEAISRRLSEKNVKQWGVPDLFLIDGGKGQVSAAYAAMRTCGYDIPMIGLAKRYEEIIAPEPDNEGAFENGATSTELKMETKPEEGSTQKGITSKTPDADASLKFNVIVLRQNDDALKLLMRIRDESHRFAVSYHSVLKRNRQKTNLLEEIPGIGPQTRKVLQRHFGSSKGVFEASEEDIASVIGTAKAKIINQYRPA